MNLEVMVNTFDYRPISPCAYIIIKNWKARFYQGSYLYII